MPAEFHFLRPEWLWGIAAIALLAFAMLRRQLAPGSWQRIVDPALAPYVLARKQVKGVNYRWWLMVLGGVIAILSIAGPSWNRVEQPVFRSEQAIVIALDLSYSMDAQDLTPSRLTRAKLKILDILERRKSGQTALVVYSANAFTVTPLTSDADTVASLVNSLSTDIMPSRGSYPPAAIDKGRQLLEQAGVGYGEVLLITDGGSSDGAERSARDLRTAGYTLSVLGVGTLQGAPIPKAGGGFVTDRSGNIAVPKLEVQELRRLASEGGGRYTTLSADDRDIDTLLSGEIADASNADGSVATDQWREEGPWLLLILVPLAALAFRRGLVLLLVLFVLPLPQNAEAFSWQDLWRNKDQQGERQLEQGDAAEAAELFKDPSWRAVASYRAGDYGGSAAGFADGEDADSLYNLGNALARLGEFESAIDAYDQALEIDPQMEDAIYNRDLLKEAAQQQQDSQGDQQGGQQSENEGGGGQQSESDSESQQQSQEGSAGEAGDQSQEGESSVRDEEMSQEDLEAMQQELERAAQQAEQQQGEAESEQSMSQAEAEQMRRMQEQQQAMEQWLRRIPNDPGGLLRRKFQYQYQRMGRDQDGNTLWPDDEAEPW
ncbi:MAG: VWA domain-containing protein [Gammaproteobacteria bacterium]|nr:VWA domain-containing protein [Gammaproteobacteria bacterium]MDH4314587.1 VWA domain-containing protein [Gammaproteobacteria bacterium]MDH5214851.1 VWA domain-containing protein [Gammaproteobacteria bacterium]